MKKIQTMSFLKFQSTTNKVLQESNTSHWDPIATGIYNESAQKSPLTRENIKQENRDIAIGLVVLVHDNTSRNKWKVGVVSNFYVKTDS